MDLSRGDVVLLSVAFASRSGSKLRPAVVVSSSQYHEIDQVLIVAPVTSRPPRNENEYFLRDWEAANLLRASTVRAKLFTVYRKHVLHRPGHLSKRDMAGVEGLLRWALEL